MTTGVIYARVSSIGDRQSTERQVKDLSEYAIPGDDPKTIGLYHDGNYYFQNFMNRYISKPINIPLVGVTILIRNLKIRRH